MKTVGNKTVDKFGLQKELRSKPIPLDQKLEVLWNQELPVEDENFISRVVANLPSGMAPEEERELESTFLKENEIPIPVVSEVADYDATYWIQPSEYCKAPVEEYDLLPYDLDEVDEEWLRQQPEHTVDDLLLEICLNFFELHSPSKGAELEEEGLVEEINNVYSKIRSGKTFDLASVQKVYSYWKAKGGVIKPIVPVLIDPRKLRAKSKRRRVTGKDTKVDWNTVFVDEGINSELEAAIYQGNLVKKHLVSVRNILQLVKRREMVNTAIVKMRRDLFDIDGAEHEIRLSERKKRKRDRDRHSSHSHRDRDRDRESSASESSSHHKKRKLHRRDSSSGREHRRHHSSSGSSATVASSRDFTSGSSTASSQHVSKETKRAAELESELSQLMASVGYNTRKKKTNYLFYDDDDESDDKKEKVTSHKSRSDRRHEATDYENDFIDVLGEDTSIFLSDETSVDSLEVVDNFYSFDESIESSEDDDSFGEEDLLPYSAPAYFKYCGGPVVCVDTTKRKILISTRRISRCGRDVLNYSLLDYGEYAHILSNDFLAHYSKDASGPWSDQFKLKIANPVPPVKPRNRSQNAKPRRRLYQQIPPLNPQQQPNTNSAPTNQQLLPSAMGAGMPSSQSNQAINSNSNQSNQPPQLLHKPRPRSPKKLFPRDHGAPIFHTANATGGNPAHAKQRHHALKPGGQQNPMHVPNNTNSNASMMNVNSSNSVAMGNVSTIPEAGRSPLVKSAETMQSSFDVSHERLVAKHPRANMSSGANHVINLVDGDGPQQLVSKPKDGQGMSLSMQGIQQHNAMQMIHQKTISKGSQGLSFQHQPLGGASGMPSPQPGSGHAIQFLHQMNHNNNSNKPMEGPSSSMNPNIPPDILPNRDRSMQLGNSAQPNIDFGAVKPNDFHNQQANSGKIPNIHLSNANRMAGNNNPSRMSNNNGANMNFNFSVNNNTGNFSSAAKFTDMSQTSLNASRPLNNENFLKNTIHNHIIKNQKAHSFNLHSSPQKQQQSAANLNSRGSMYLPPLHLKNQTPGQLSGVQQLNAPNAPFSQQISKTQGLSHSPIGTVGMQNTTLLNSNNSNNLMNANKQQPLMIHTNVTPQFNQFSVPSHLQTNSLNANEKMNLGNQSVVSPNVLPNVLPLSKANSINNLVNLSGNVGPQSMASNMGNVNFPPSMSNANLNMPAGMGKSSSAPSLSSQTSSFMLNTVQQPPPAKHVTIYSQSQLAQQESLLQQHQLTMSQQQHNQRNSALSNQQPEGIQNMNSMNPSMRANPTKRPQQPSGVSPYAMQLPGAQGAMSHQVIQPIGNTGPPNQQQHSLMHNEQLRLQQIVQQQKLQLQQQGQLLPNPMIGMKPPPRDQLYSHQLMSTGESRGKLSHSKDDENKQQYMSLPMSSTMGQSNLHPSQKLKSPEPFGQPFHSQNVNVPSFPMQQSLPHQLPNLMQMGMGQQSNNNQTISFHNFS